MRAKRWQRDYSYTVVAAALLVLLLGATAIVDPAVLQAANVSITVAAAAPLILAAMAQTPVVLGGGGGIDLSVGALMGLVNAVIVGVVVGRMAIQSVAFVALLVVVLGAFSGIINGVLVVFVRLQPIVATLGTFLVYSGLTLYILPAPGGNAPAWATLLAGQAGGVPGALLVLLPVVGGWSLLTRLPWYSDLLAVGDNDRAAYTAGVDVARVRLGAYVVAGVMAAGGGLSLTALLGGGDPTVGITYTLIAIAGVALGGVSLAGGRGGMLGAVVGALDILLVQNFLTYLNVSTFMLRVADGLILVATVILNTLAARRWSAVP